MHVIKKVLRVTFEALTATGAADEAGESTAENFVELSCTFAKSS